MARSEMEVAFRELRKTVSEQRTAITEQRETQMSVQPLASNDSQHRIAANSKQKVEKIDWRAGYRKNEPISN